MFSLRRALVIALLAFPAACGSNDQPAAPSPTTPSPTPAPPPSRTTAAVSIPSNASTLGNRAYAPAELNVAAGTTVSWTNTDSVAHTSTSDGAGWDSVAIASGGRFSFTFQNAGTFPYHCTIHPGMVGRVVVQ
jgi:plastocyanin